MAAPEEEGISVPMPLTAGTVLAPARRSPRWTVWVKAILLAAILAALYARELNSLVFEVLASVDFSFVFLAFPLWMVFLYCRRETFARTPAKPETVGLCLVALACLVFIVGRASAELFSTRVSLILLLAGLIWMFAGRRWLQLLSLPLLLLACLIPPPAIFYNSLSNPVKDILVRIGSSIAQLLGLSFYADGGSVNVPGFSVGTGEMCGSLHVIPALFISALMIVLLIAPRRTTPGLALFTAFFAVFTAIAAILLRMILVAVFATHSPDWTAGFYHAATGWSVFLAGLIAAIVIAALAARQSGKAAA